MRRVIGLRMSEACDGPYSGDQIKPTFSMSVFGPMVAWAFKGRVLRAVFRILEDEAFEMNSLQTRLNELFPNDNETLFSEAAGKDMNVHFWLDSDGIPESDYEQDEESDEAIMEHIDNVITTVR